VAQFDVHANPSGQRDAIPFVVILQNARYTRARTRCVAALVRRSLAAPEPHGLAPHFTVTGIDVVLNVFNLATVPLDRLGPSVASLADDVSAAKLVRALEEFTAQA
jgi:toxin CcdB